MDTNEATEKLNQAGETINRFADSARGALSDFSGRFVERSKAAASSTDAYVHEYAWSSVAVAALLGIIVGLMIRRS